MPAVRNPSGNAAAFSPVMVPDGGHHLGRDRLPPHDGTGGAPDVDFQPGIFQQAGDRAGAADRKHQELVDHSSIGCRKGTQASRGAERRQALAWTVLVTNPRQHRSSKAAGDARRRGAASDGDLPKMPVDVVEQPWSALRAATTPISPESWRAISAGVSNRHRPGRPPTR